jgi:hypothetical protein
MRDRDKVRSYVKGQRNREMRENIEREKLLFLQRYGISFNDAMEYLKQSRWDFTRRLQAANTPPAVPNKSAGKRCREMEINLHLDLPAPNGFPSVSVCPTEAFYFSKGLCVRVNAYKNGEKLELCNLHFTQ